MTMFLANPMPYLMPFVYLIGGLWALFAVGVLIFIVAHYVSKNQKEKENGSPR